jgi:hypothetical protein
MMTGNAREASIDRSRARPDFHLLEVFLAVADSRSSVSHRRR